MNLCHVVEESGLSVVLIPLYHDDMPCADVYVKYNGVEINVKDTTSLKKSATKAGLGNKSFFLTRRKPHINSKKQHSSVLFSRNVNSLIPFDAILRIKMLTLPICNPLYEGELALKILGRINIIIAPIVKEQKQVK